MALELVYTSVPTGLKRGAYGFCTVACTKNIPAIIASTLENLSGYRHLYPAGSQQNPVVYSHLALKLGGLPGHILSRIADAGLDYTQRTNKLAHHVVLQDQIDDLPLAGPAALFTRPDMFLTQWNQEPAYFPNEKQIPAFDVPSAVCRRWGSAVGDPGWGGVLAGSVVLKRPVAIIYTPGTDIFPLFCESVALLPHDLRWNATFTTFYTKLPPGTSCLWKGVIAGSTEEAQARAIPKTIVINLSESQIGRQIEDWESSDPEVARLIDIARNGAPKPASPRRSANRNGQPAAVPPRQQQTEMDDFDAMLGELTGTAHRTAVYTGRKPVSSRMSMDGTSFDYDDEDGKGANWGLIIGIISAVLILLLVGGGITGYTIYSRYQNSQNQPVANGDNPDSDQTEDSEFNDPTTPSETPTGATEEPEQLNSPEDIENDGKTPEVPIVTQAKNKLARLEDKPKNDDVNIPEVKKSIVELIDKPEIGSILETKNCLTEIIRVLENKSTDQTDQTGQISADQFSNGIESIKDKIERIKNLLKDKDIGNPTENDGKKLLTEIKTWNDSIYEEIKGIDKSEEDTSKLNDTVSNIASIKLDLEVFKKTKKTLEENKNDLEKDLTKLSDDKVKNLLKDVNEIINKGLDNQGMKDVKAGYDEIYGDIGIDDDHKGTTIEKVEKRIKDIDEFIDSVPEDNLDHCLCDILVARTNDLQTKLTNLLQDRIYILEEENARKDMEEDFKSAKLKQEEEATSDSSEEGHELIDGELGNQPGNDIDNPVPGDTDENGEGSDNEDTIPKEISESLDSDELGATSKEDNDKILLSFNIEPRLDVEKINRHLEKYNWSIGLDYTPISENGQTSYTIEKAEVNGKELFSGILKSIQDERKLLNIVISEDKIVFKAAENTPSDKELDDIRNGIFSFYCADNTGESIANIKFWLPSSQSIRIKLRDKGKRITEVIDSSKINSEQFSQLLSNRTFTVGSKVSKLNVDTTTRRNNRYGVFIKWNVTIENGFINISEAYTTDKNIRNNKNNKPLNPPLSSLNDFCKDQANACDHTDEDDFNEQAYIEDIKQAIQVSIKKNNDYVTFKYKIEPIENNSQQLKIIQIQSNK